MTIKNIVIDQKEFSKQIHILLTPLKGHMVNVHVERRMVEPASHIFVIVAQKVSV